MTRPMTTSDQNGYSISLAAPSLAELALLLEQVSEGLGRHTAKPGVSLRSFQWRPEEEETIWSMKAVGASPGLPLCGPDLPPSLTGEGAPRPAGRH